MAQSYQDLSGQIIRTVIKLVVELERTLAHFSELAGDSPVGARRPGKRNPTAMALALPFPVLPPMPWVSRKTLMRCWRGWGCR